MNLALQILEASYWEHFKSAKDISRFLPIDNPKRVEIENELNKIAKEIQAVKKKK